MDLADWFCSSIISIRAIRFDSPVKYMIFSLTSIIIFTYLAYKYRPWQQDRVINGLISSLSHANISPTLTGMLYMIGERAEGLWYLIRGPSSLQKAYTRVSKSLL